MINYLIANGGLFISIYIVIEAILIFKYLYPNKKKMSLKTLVFASIIILVVFAVLTYIISITDYTRWGNTKFLDIKDKIFNKILPNAIMTGIICVCVVIVRYVYNKCTKRRKDG